MRSQIPNRASIVMANTIIERMAAKRFLEVNIFFFGFIEGKRKKRKDHNEAFKNCVNPVR
jgi:hypothetical protein